MRLGPGRTLHRYMVESWDEETQGWSKHGSVCLPVGAPDHEIEHALAAVGVYAPRGMDWTEWRVVVDGHPAMAKIRDASDRIIVLLRPVSARVEKATRRR